MGIIIKNMNIQWDIAILRHGEIENPIVRQAMSEIRNKK
jgi:hypothetical protein